ATQPPFTPSFADRYSNATSLQKTVFGITLRDRLNQFGPLWALTDYATAVRLGMTPVAIQFTPGAEFIKPTPETIAAGVATLTQGRDGLLERDVTKAPAPGAYPLSMVEYALAPSDPLPAARCAEAPFIDNWLHYTAGDGQAALPAEYLHLTADLQAQAKAA